MTDLYKAAKIKYEIDSGEDVLEFGFNLAWELWNILCFTFVGEGNSNKYPGKFDVDKTLRKLPQAVALSDRCYSYTLTLFDGSLKSWWSNLKRFKQGNTNSSTEGMPKPPKPSHSPKSLKFEKGRNLKYLGGNKFQLTVLGGKVENRHAIITLKIRKGIKLSQIKMLDLSPDNTGSAIVKYQQKDYEGNNIASLDLGIVNLGVLAFNNGESILVSGKGLISEKQYLNKRESKCKPSGWSKGKKAQHPSKNNIKWQKKIGNVQTLVCHNFTTFVVRELIKRQVGILIVGDLKGIRDKSDHGSAGNQKLHSWPFYKITQQLEYKCAEYGIELVKVSERNTSKCCHICGEVGSRNPRGLLKCKNCGITINSDVNGAFGILNKLHPHLVDQFDKLEQKIYTVSEDYKKEEDNKKRHRLNLKKNELCINQQNIEMMLQKVSPEPYTCFGVEGVFPTLRSLPDVTEGIRETRGNRPTPIVDSCNVSQIEPTFTARFDLRNWSISNTVESH